MKEEFTQISDHIEVVRRRFFPFAATFVTVLSIAILLAVKLPATYESKATILIEGQEIPKEFVRSTVTTYADEQIQIIAQRVMVRDNLQAIINQFDLFGASDSAEAMELAIDSLRESIFIDPVRASVVDERTQRTGYVTIAFNVRVEYGDPSITKQIADQLAELFLQANTLQRTTIAAETTEFLEAEARKLDNEIIEMEKRMAEFKERNEDSLPELANLNFQQLERAERDLEQTERDIRQNQERRSMLQAEVAGMSPYKTTTLGDGGELVSTEDRLAALQRELLSKSSIYSDDHPDISRLKREIALLGGNTASAADIPVLRRELESTRLRLQEAQRKYSNDHPDVIRLKLNVANLETRMSRARDSSRFASSRRAPDNPRYVQLQAQLEYTNQEAYALASKRDELRRAVTSYSDRLTRTPQTEREWLSVTRNYDGAVEKYRIVRAQLDDANRAKTLETVQKGERFSLLDAPRLPNQPIRPNRPFIFFAGFIFAIALSAGVVIILETIDSTIRGSRDVNSLMGSPPIATVPVISNSGDIARSNRQKLLTGALFATAIALLIIQLL